MDFVAQILAKLDTDKAKSELKDFVNDKYKLDVEVNLTNENLDINKLLGKQFSNVGNTASKAGRDIGRQFVKNMESTINSGHINQLIDRLNAKNITKDIVSGVEKNLTTLTNKGIQIKGIQEVVSDKDGLVKITIDGIDEAENAIKIVETLNKKTKEWETKTTHTMSFADMKKGAEQTKKSLLELDEVERRLNEAQSKHRSMFAKFGAEDEFSGSLAKLGDDIQDAMNSLRSGTADATQLNNALSKIESTVSALSSETREWNKNNTTVADASKRASDEAKKQVKATEKQAELQSKLNALRKQNANILDRNSDKYNEDIDNEFKSVEQSIKGISNLSTSRIASNALDGLVADLKTINTEANKAKSSVHSIDDLKDSYDSYNKRVDTIKSSNLSKYENTSSYASILNNLEQIKAIQDRINSEGFGNDVDLSKRNKDLREMNLLLKKTETLSTNLTKPITSLEASIASNKTLSWLKNNTKATKELGDAFELLAQKQRQATTRGELESYNKEFNNLVSKAKASGLTGKTMFGDMKRAFGQIAQFTSIYGIIQNVIEEVPRQMVQNVKQVDEAMTNLRMATSVSTEEAQRLMSTYSKMGKELKATSTDIAASATDWLKQGKTIKEANQLTEDAIVLSKIGDMSSEDATKTITAAMKSYKMSADEVMGFVDQISAIDMASATDVGGLSDAFNEVAANARLAGVETEKLLSYAAVIGETSQEGMSGVGTALNAIFSRMGNIKLSRLKDYENGGEDLSNVETVLRKNGIALRDAEGQFREFDEVLDETASKWENFDSVTRRAVGNAFAGTHHANSFVILMEQYGQAQKYMDIANNSSGESMEKFSAYQESLAGSIEGFKNSFQGLSNTVISSDFLTNVIDAGTTLLDLLNSLIDNFGILQTLFGGLAIGKGITSFVKGFDKSVLVIRLG